MAASDKALQSELDRLALDEGRQNELKRKFNDRNNK